MERFVATLVAGAPAAGTRVLRLFGSPRLTHGGVDVDLPEGTKRLVAFVALHGRGIRRTQVATTLWPTVNTARADGNLRSTLWRLRRAHADILVLNGDDVALGQDVLVDVRILEEWAGRAVDGHLAEADLATGRLSADMLELLPGWYDDWVVAERERLRQRLLDGLEAVSRHLANIERASDAVTMAMIAVAADPLRESAHRTLIEVHLADGNVIEARHSFQAYRRLLDRELGVEPDPALAALLRPRPRTAA